jgi:hypothetical protein
MFLKRRKLLLFVIVVGIAWIALTTLLGRSSHSTTQHSLDRQKSTSKNRQPEFYYDSEDEVIELEAAKVWARVKVSTQWSEHTWKPPPSSAIPGGQEEQDKHRHNEQELEEIPELGDIPEIGKLTPALEHQVVKEFEEDIPHLTTRNIKRAGLNWTPARDLKAPAANSSPG